MRKTAVIVGVGGFAREVLGILRCLSVRRSLTCEIRGFVDDNPDHRGQMLNGLPILGGYDWLEQQDTNRLVAVCAIENPLLRRQVTTRFQRLGLEFITVVHPGAVIPANADPGQGSILADGAIVTSSAIIGRHVHLHAQTCVSRHSVVEDYCSLSQGVHVSGNVRIGRGCQVGTGASIASGVRIGEWSVIGAGSSVIADLPPNAAGLPG